MKGWRWITGIALLGLAAAALFVFDAWEFE